MMNLLIIFSFVANSLSVAAGYYLPRFKAGEHPARLPRSCQAHRLRSLQGIDRREHGRSTLCRVPTSVPDP